MPNKRGHILVLVLTNGDRVPEVVVGENLGSSEHQYLWFGIKTNIHITYTKTKVLDIKWTNFNKIG